MAMKVDLKNVNWTAVILEAAVEARDCMQEQIEQDSMADQMRDFMGGQSVGDDGDDDVDDYADGRNEAPPQSGSVHSVAAPRPMSPEVGELREQLALVVAQLAAQEERLAAERERSEANSRELRELLRALVLNGPDRGQEQPEEQRGPPSDDLSEKAGELRTAGVSSSLVVHTESSPSEADAEVSPALLAAATWPRETEVPTIETGDAESPVEIATVSPPTEAVAVSPVIAAILPTEAAGEESPVTTASASPPTEASAEATTPVASASPAAGAEASPVSSPSTEAEAAPTASVVEVAPDATERNDLPIVLAASEPKIETEETTASSPARTAEAPTSIETETLSATMTSPAGIEIESEPEEAPIVVATASPSTFDVSNVIELAGKRAELAAASLRIQDHPMQGAAAALQCGEFFTARTIFTALEARVIDNGLPEGSELIAIRRGLAESQLGLGDVPAALWTSKNARRLASSLLSREPCERTLLDYMMASRVRAVVLIAANPNGALKLLKKTLSRYARANLAFKNGAPKREAEALIALANGIEIDARSPRDVIH